MFTRLTDRSVLALSGPDVRKFLQGLITNDVKLLTPEHALYAAMLTGQGKILYDFLVVDDGETVLLDCDATAAEPLAKRLAMYRLRAKVDIAPRPDLVVLAAWDGSTLPGLVFDDPRLPALGRRAIAPAELGQEGADSDTYVAHRLALGVPQSGDFGSDAIYALDAGFEELHGVSFTKGCYVGQELTARMKHRGTARKRVLPVRAGAALPALGTAITANGKSVGELTAVYGDAGFALIRLDRLEEAGDAALGIGGMAVTLTRPEWLGG